MFYKHIKSIFVSNRKETLCNSFNSNLFVCNIQQYYGLRLYSKFWILNVYVNGIPTYYYMHEVSSAHITKTYNKRLPKAYPKNE